MSESDRSPLRDLIHAVLDGTASETDCARLQQTLAESAEARSLYLRYVNLHCTLKLMAGPLDQREPTGESDHGSEDVVQKSIPAVTRVPSATLATRSFRWAIVVASTVAIALLAVWSFVSRDRPNPTDGAMANKNAKGDGVRKEATPKSEHHALRVVSVEGKLDLLSDGETSELAMAGVEVPAGVKLRCGEEGANAVVEVAGKRLYLNSNTSLELVKNAKTAQVFVEHGEVRIESVAEKELPSFVLQTPHAEMRDGGTAEIAVSGKSTRVALNDGNLQITRRFDRTHLDLEAGAWVSTGSPQEPMKPERSSDQTPVVLFNVRAEQLALSPDAKTMAIFTGKSVEIWDVASRNRTLILDPARKRITGLTFSPNGDWLVLGDRQPFLQVWDWRQCKLLRILESLDGEEEAIWPAFSGDGTKLYCLAHRPWRMVGMRGWKVADWSVAPSLTRDSDVKYLFPIATAPSVLGGMRNGSLLVWNAAEDRQERMILFGKQSWKPVAVSKNAEMVAFGSAEGTTLWDLRQGKALWQFEGQGCCAFSPDGKTLVVGSFGFLDFLEVATGQRIATYRTEGDRARWLSFSNDGQELYVLSGPKNRVHSWKVPALPSY